MSNFVHFHLHSEYSVSDSLIRIPKLIAQSKELNMPAVALTDINNLFALVKFYRAATAAKIKPIIGAEITLEKNVSLLLLCQEQTGFINLSKLLSEFYLEKNSFAKLKDLNEGLIAIICVQTDSKKTQELWNDLHKVFANRLYLEICRVNKTDENKYIQEIVEFAGENNAPLIATNDVRFLVPEDYEAHTARVCIQQGITLTQADREQYKKEQYLKSAAQMQELFFDIPEAIANSVELVKRCNFKLEFGEVFLPKFPHSAEFTTEQFLERETAIGLETKVLPKIQNKKHTLADYKNRLIIELKVINQMGFAGYFLIVADFIRWAKQQDIPVGPGRGSGAGSLVAYVLDITDIDPLPYNLLFERFLNPERVSMPDFDIDFCINGRDRVIEYVANTYGKASVSQIITYGTMAAKAVVRDVGRVLGNPYGFVDKIAKLIPFEIGITLDKALKQDETLRQRYKEEDEVRVLLDLARQLEGLTRNVGKHAGGVVIAPSDLTNFSPLYSDPNEGGVITQLDKNDVETVGLVKFDFLGLRTLTIIDWTLKSINKKIDINDIPIDDEKTYKLISACNTTALFQLESRGMKDLVRRLQPTEFEDIVDLVALFRPGPLQSGMVDDYVDRKHGRSKIDYPHESLIEILKPTYGVILYQEQVMQIAQVLSKFTLGGADLLRRAMGKKKPEEMAKQRDAFVEGAVANNIAKKTASNIFDLIEKFAGYGFNKSHSAAYAQITYQTAWLKTHYKAEFMAAVMSSVMSNTDKIVEFIDDCRQQDLTVLSPDINSSYYKFVANPKGEIIYGLGAMKGVGEAAIEAIVAARQMKGDFQDIYDVTLNASAGKITKKVLEVLIKSGALDQLGEHRAALMASIPQALTTAQQYEKNSVSGQADLFGSAVIAKPQLQHDMPVWSDRVRLQGEKDTLGLYLTGHPIDDYSAELYQIASSKIVDLTIDLKQSSIAGLVIAMRVRFTKRGDKIAFLTLDDKTGRQDIAVFTESYKKYEHLLAVGRILIVSGDIGHDDFSGGLKFVVNEIQSIANMRNRMKKLIIKLHNSNLINDIALIMQKSPGNCPINIEYQTENETTTINLGARWKVAPNDDLITDLQELCGRQQVELCY